MTFKNILFEVAGPVGIVTINRPKVLNALNLETISELDIAIRRADADPDLRVVIITGAGERAFVSGADIAEMLKMSREQAKEFSEQGHRLMFAIERSTKPVIAAVCGYALGGGTELALACDFIYAADNAKFGLPEVKLGIFPGFGGTQRLSRRIGPARACELIFTGRIIDANCALELGLVNKVTPAAKLKDEVNAVAREIVENGPLAVAGAKQVCQFGANSHLVEGLANEQVEFARLFTSADRIEGMTAFIEKRKADFKAR